MFAVFGNEPDVYIIKGTKQTGRRHNSGKLIIFAFWI